jgi:hypothetical protein
MSPTRSVLSLSRRLLRLSLPLPLLWVAAACSGSVAPPSDEPDGGDIVTPGPDAALPPPDAALAPDAATEERGPLPVLFIDTGFQQIVEDVKIAASLRIVEDHDGSLVDIDSRPVSYQGAIGIEIRGNMSTMFPKKSYGFETRDGVGADLDVPLLGMPEESDWVLYAPYTDKTYLRDRLAYDLGAALGRYQPRSRFVELYLDGDYQGVYLLLEKIKRGPDRVDIDKVAPSAAAGDLSGGYIFKAEGGGDGFDVPWEYHYPKASEITDEQRDYLDEYIDRFEATMLGDEFSTPYGYAAWIDIPSFVDFVVITELSRNVDGYRKSAYLYKEADEDGGRLFAGPLWDFNIAFGNADYCDGFETRGFQYRRDLGCEDELQIPAWWPRLMQDDDFADAVRCRWDSLRSDLLSDAALADRLADYRALLATAEPRDHTRWPVLGKYVWPNYFIGDSWDEELEHLQGWITDRTAWLDANLPGICN